MASVKRWAVVVLVGCTAIAVAYLPPRGGARSRPSEFFTGRVLQLTPARLRAQVLAEEWRTADGALRLLQERQRLKQVVSQRRIHDSRPSIVFNSETAVAPAAVQMVASAMDTVWRDLGLGETKVQVAIVVEMWRAVDSPDQPRAERDRVTYLTPDSTDRTTCIAFLPAGRYWTRVIDGEQPGPVDPRQLVQMLKAGLGPCAFYAAFGTPGRPVRRWLAARNWDVALRLDGDRAGVGSGRSNWLGDPRFRWYWDAVYSFPPATVACFAGRSHGCRTAVLGGTAPDRDLPVPQIVRAERRWWRAQQLLPGERYLSDVAREVGRDRFQRFWTSPLPVDTALAAALKHPVGEWTQQWQRRFIPPIRLGAAAPLGASALALVLAAAAVAAVALTASRRQVR